MTYNAIDLMCLMPMGSRACPCSRPQFSEHRQPDPPRVRPGPAGHAGWAVPPFRPRTEVHPRCPPPKTTNNIHTFMLICTQLYSICSHITIESNVQNTTKDSINQQIHQAKIPIIQNTRDHEYQKPNIPQIIYA